MRYIDDDLANKRILITGGAGFIGSNLALYFQKYHPKAEVVVFDCFRGQDSEMGLGSLGHFENLLGFEGEVIAGNINNKEDLEKLESFDYVFHQAAISDTTIQDQEIALRSNVNAFKDLLRWCHKNKTAMIYASSAGVYGNTAAPNRVGHGEIPENVYGFSKLMMDNLAHKYMRSTNKEGVSVIGLRYFNVYGENEFHKGRTASMVLQLGMQALKQKKVRLFKGGEQMRDFVYVQDVIQANIKAVQAIQSRIKGIYNVGTGIARSYNDVIDCLKNSLGDFDVEYFENPYKFFQTHTQADIALTRQDLGYEPKFSLEDGIKSYLEQIQTLYLKGQ